MRLFFNIFNVKSIVPDKESLDVGDDNLLLAVRYPEAFRCLGPDRTRAR
jgi:hypothetical protein